MSQCNPLDIISYPSPKSPTFSNTMSLICSEEGPITPSDSPPLPSQAPASLQEIDWVTLTNLAPSMMPIPSLLAQQLTGAFPRLNLPFSLPGLTWGQSLDSVPSVPHDTSSIATYLQCRDAYTLAATRKYVTKESTAILKVWLNEHGKNPYPTKGEKIRLAIISKMTLTQVFPENLTRKEH